MVISRILTSGGLCRVVENVVDSSRFDRIDTNRFSCCRFVMPESRFACIVISRILTSGGLYIQGG